jgi:hypothetical protein
VSDTPSRPLLLSVDLEEFDAAPPRDPAAGLDAAVAASRRGLDRLLPLLESLGMRATFFTTVVFAERNAPLLRELAGRHEIASHGVRHREVSPADVGESKRRLEDLLGVPIAGFRMPRMGAVDPAAIEAAGYAYDASLHPAWIPGRYDRRREPRRPFLCGGLLRVPASVTPRLRLPLFWLSIKHLPPPIIRRAALRTLRHDGDLNLYVHPWEFTDLDEFEVPFILRGRGGDAMRRRTERLLRSLLAESAPATYAEQGVRWRASLASSPA